MNTSTLSRRSTLLVYMALALCSIASVGMVALRLVYSGHRGYTFMVWNLFLAWIPLGLSCLAHWSYGRKERIGAQTIFWSLLWLLFLPNAPYLATDVLHLHPSRHSPLWFDLILLLIFALTGLLLGYVSLFSMQDMVTRARGKVTSWAFVIVVLGLSSFGIYLGRFLRWNSWDLLLNPSGVAFDVIERFLRPHEHVGAFAMTFFMMVMLMMPYLVIYGLTRVRS